jgi:hypothetical protein
LKYGLELVAEDAEEMGQAGREEVKETGIEEVKKAFAAWLKKCSSKNRICRDRTTAEP